MYSANRAFDPAYPFHQFSYHLQRLNEVSELGFYIAHIDHGGVASVGNRPMNAFPTSKLACPTLGPGPSL